MAYVPPHKRHSDNADKIPVPDSLAPRFKETLNLGFRSMSHGRRNEKQMPGMKITYAKDSISRWWPFGSTMEDPIPTSSRLEPFPSRSVDQRIGKVPLVLVGGQVPAETSGVAKNEPWVSITEKVLPDLLATLENLSNELQPGADAFKPSLVARFGKILFHGGSFQTIDNLRKAALLQSGNTVHKSFHTNVPKDFFECVEEAVPHLGIAFESEKEHYRIKISDKEINSIISCKCILLKGAKDLEVYKMELIPVRHLVFDISCLYKDMDLRIMLCNKRIAVDLDDEEKDCINKLVKAAIIDPDVKGGLRWPLGKASAGDRFTVVGVWHTVYKTFRGPTLRLKMRNANRFDFKASLGEATTEISLKMTELSNFLANGVTDPEPVRRMLEGNMELIWNHIMSCKYTIS